MKRDLVVDDDLYKTIILEHYAHPPHKGALADHTHHEEGFNPSCGDEIEVFLRVEDNTVTKASFDGVGCSLCLASASMLTTLLPGKTLDEAKQLQSAFKNWITVRDPEPSPVDLDELEALGGVRNYPVRIKCVLLAWETFVGAVEKT